jgi:ectoine hydroxylase-related dioxygenase (phytanoyl-CoA dioxygenase family)
MNQLEFSKYKKKIKQQGFVVVKKAFSVKSINSLKIDLASMRNATMKSTVSEKKIDSKLIVNPHSSSFNFCKIIFSNIVERFCLEFLNDKFYRTIKKNLPNYCLNHSIVRSSGRDVLNFHRDDRNPPSRSKEICYLQFGLALEKVTKENGCTTIIPKSHLIESYVQNVNKYKHHYLCMEQGDLLIYDGRLWHSALSNFSEKTRWMFFFGFARWHLRQTYDYAADLNKKILKKLSIKDILKIGFHAITKKNENNQKFGAGQRGDLNYAKENVRNRLKNSYSFT